MSRNHFKFWPPSLPRDIHVPQTSLYYNLEVAANRYPDKPAIVFYDAILTYRQLRDEVERMAGFLQQHCRVAKGDRVMLYSQNCPQLVIAFFAVLRADAVVVPVNAMNLCDEVDYIRQDSGARVIFTSQELLPQIASMLEKGELSAAIVHAYSSYLGPESGCAIPAWVAAPEQAFTMRGAVDWRAALEAGHRPGPHSAEPGDMCMLPYTSGTTGHPKACIHTHETVMASIAAAQVWRGTSPEAVILGVAPMFHLLGITQHLLAPALLGATSVMLPRWDRLAAAHMIERYGVTTWIAPPPVMLDFFGNDEVLTRELGTLQVIGGGGAAMPEGVAATLAQRFGLVYNEGYGMTEQAGFVSCNPLHRPKRQCLGIPTFGVDMRIIDPDTLRELQQGEVGEIIISGRQVMVGYWNNDAANATAFMQIDGKRFMRSGDLGYVDEEGYFFMTDRLKRMINASGFKVWPAEVENAMYAHPDIREVCVIATPDAHRGQNVKAAVVLRDGAHGKVTPEEITAWCKERMATYKAPRIIEFVAALPRGSTGKINWRELQEQEDKRALPDRTSPSPRGCATS